MFSGVVSKVSRNPWQGKTLHSFKINTADGYFNTGTVDPGVNEGESIKFDAKPAKREGNFDVVVKSITRSTDTPVSPDQYAMTSQNPNGARRSASVMTKDNYWEDRAAKDVETQKRIEIQAARNAAIALLGALSGSDPEDVGEFINEWTDKFLKNNADRLA